MQKRIVAEWLPSSGYEYAPAADIAVYPAGDQQTADYRTEIRLPIIKKSLGLIRLYPCAGGGLIGCHREVDNA